METFAESTPAELIEINDELQAINKKLNKMIEIDEFTEENVEKKLARLGEIDKLRVHNGRFLPIPIAQAATLSLLFECYEKVSTLRLRKFEVDLAVANLHKEIVDFEIVLVSAFNFERFNISIVNLREYETMLYAIRNVKFQSPEFKFSSGGSKLIMYRHLARCHNLIRVLLLGVEDLSEALLYNFEQLMKLHFEIRDEFYCAMRSQSGAHYDLKHARETLQEVEKTAVKGVYFGDSSEIDMHEVPTGQTIIKSLIEEVHTQTGLMEAWLTSFY